MTITSQNQLSLETSASPRAAWAVDPSITFLNHGSYGICPRAVLDFQTDLRERMERDPARFFKVDLERLMDAMRRRLGTFLNCPPQDLAPVPNATVAIATILFNTPFKPGDEVLLTDHEYSSGTNELARLAPHLGIKVVTAKVPFPISTPDQVTDAVLSAITPRTRLVIVSHITSATSLIFPVQPIVAECNARGIDILVDGAHAPGQIPIDLEALKPTYYVGSFHKWLCSPKGTGLMYVRPDKQEGFRTVVLSSRADKIRPDRALFLRDFDYMGTADYTGILSVPAAIDAVASLIDGGWPAVMRHNHRLIIEARRILTEATGLSTPAPERMIGSMATLILPAPDAEFANRPTIYDDPLQDALMDRHKIQVPVWPFGQGPTALRLLRISAQLYNSLDQYRRLAEALNIELARERSLRRTG